METRIHLDHLGSRLMHCVDVARQIEELNDTTEEDFGALVIAAAILNSAGKTLIVRPLPESGRENP
jgi:hypothetical protein